MLPSPKARTGPTSSGFIEFNFNYRVGDEWDDGNIAATDTRGDHYFAWLIKYADCVHGGE